jgi:hypothetical protein
MARQPIIAALLIPGRRAVKQIARDHLLRLSRKLSRIAEILMNYRWLLQLSLLGNERSRGKRRGIGM